MKELIIVPKVSKSKMGAFLAEIKHGVKTVYADPKNIGLKDGCTSTKEAKYVIIKNNATKYKIKKSISGDQRYFTASKKRT